MTERRRLIVADDCTELLDGVCALLELEFAVVDAVRDGGALVRSTGAIRPDAVVCDIRLPGGGGIAAGERILKEGLAKAVIVLSMYKERHLVRKAFAAGIGAYVLKTDAGDELIPAIYSALRGERFLSTGIGHSIADLGVKPGPFSEQPAL